MLKPLVRVLALIVLASAGAVGLYYYHYRTTEQYELEQKEKQIQALQQEKQQLQQVIARLKIESRVARFRVTDQKTVDGKLKTTLRFEEFRRDGTGLPPRQFVIDGNEAHFDAEIVKFDDRYVEAGDPLRGQSIILLLRLYGADQTPNDGFAIDPPGGIPDIYRGADPSVPKFEQHIWDNFWRLFNDQAARQSEGIRRLHGEGLWGRLEPGHVYTIEIRPEGGSIHEEPEESIYRDALQTTHM